MPEPAVFVHLQYAMGKVAIERGDFAAARSHLGLALSVESDNEKVSYLLARLDALEFRVQKGEQWEIFRDLTVGRNAKYRRRQQGKLTTLAPRLAEVMTIICPRASRAGTRLSQPVLCNNRRGRKMRAREWQTDSQSFAILLAGY